MKFKKNNKEENVIFYKIHYVFYIDRHYSELFKWINLNLTLIKLNLTLIKLNLTLIKLNLT